MAGKIKQTERDLEFRRVAVKIANRITAKIRQAPSQGPATKALVGLLTRVTNACTSIGVLIDKSPRQPDADCATILRSMYDAMLQGLYILKDPTQREKRARLFLDYVVVERYRFMELLDGNPTPFAKKLKSSPARSLGEPELGQKFNQVKSQFLTPKGKLRTTWYEGSLRDLARHVGLEDEYEILQRILSNIVHSTPLTLRYGPLIRGNHLPTFAWQFGIRLLGAVADYAGVSLDDEERDLVESMDKSVLGS